MQKYFRPLLTYDTEGILALILIDQHSVTQMLYMSLSFNSGDTGQFIFFLSLHCGKRQKDRETGVSFWCQDVGSKAVPSQAWKLRRGLCALCLERQGPSLHVGAEALCAILACCVSVPAAQDDEQVWRSLENKLHEPTVYNTHYSRSQIFIQGWGRDRNAEF